MKVAIVTPTIGKPELSDALRSVQKQTYKDITHYVFIDGMEHEEHIWKLQIPNNVKFVRIDENVGKGWYGHRVYAACSFLVNADIIIYLPERICPIITFINFIDKFLNVTRFNPIIFVKIYNDISINKK